MKNYKIVLRSSGPVTQLPDSQKIFGALVTELSRMQGEDAASEVVQSVYNRNIHFALSNLFPKGYLPVPQEYILGKIAESLSKEDDLKEQRGKMKKRTYIKEEQLSAVLNHPGSCCDLYPYIREFSGQQLRASMEREDQGIEGLEKKLFTVPVTILRKINTADEKEDSAETVSEFCFYLQGDSDPAVTAIVDTAEQMKRRERPLILGKRASQGLNKYYVREILCLEEDFTVSDTGMYLNLGMLLPDQIDYKKSWLNLFTSERKPFSMPGGWKEIQTRWFISFIGCGSVIALRDGIEHAGRCVWSEIGKGTNLVFGNAVLYPITLRGK